MRTASLQPTFSEYIPTQLDEGVLYVSMSYATALHLCACGCGSKVVTPLGPADWQLVFDGAVTLRPSIGNGQLPCRSHYYIRNDRIDWMRPISLEATDAATQRDRAALRDPGSASVAHPSWAIRLWKHLRALVGLDRRTP